VKGNQEKLLELLESQNYASSVAKQAQSEDKGHGRVDTRILTVIPKTVQMDTGFPYIQQVFKIERIRSSLDRKLISSEISYGITSASPENLSPQRLLEGIRGHWVIENSDHYVKDVTFKEDACRIREPKSAQIMSIFRHLSINVLRLLEFPSMAEGMRFFTFGAKSLALRTLGIN